MNPCTVMGGFYFEAGRCLFGCACVIGVIVVFTIVTALATRKRK
jgi:hypothetical protein